MQKKLSARLQAVIEALPLRPGIRVLEIGCGPGVAARAIAHRIGDGHVPFAKGNSAGNKKLWGRNRHRPSEFSPGCRRKL